MNIALCCIGRLENKYAVEFVEYYKQLKVDHIYIYDNNCDGEEYFEDVIQSYINENFVTIIDYRNQKNCQTYVYTTFYKEYHTEYDYIIYVDFDEFIYLVKDKTIKEYLNRNKDNYNIIQLNWMIYTDNNLVYYDNRTCIERFTTPMEIYKCVSMLYMPENYHIKCIIKCDFEEILFDNPHCPNLSYNKDINKYKACNNAFIDKQNKTDFYESNKDASINYDLAYIKHFMFKTIDEYMRYKCTRGVIDESTLDDFRARYSFRFFKVNDRTKEKEKYCKLYNINYITL